jgi:hypothetical protein
VAITTAIRASRKLSRLMGGFMLDTSRMSSSIVAASQRLARVMTSVAHWPTRQKRQGCVPTAIDEFPRQVLGADIATLSTCSITAGYACGLPLGITVGQLLSEVLEQLVCLEKTHPTGTGCSQSSFAWGRIPHCLKSSRADCPKAKNYRTRTSQLVEQWL